MRSAAPGLIAGLILAVAMVACSQAAPPAVQPGSGGISAVEGATPAVTGVVGHFNPTEAVGGGANSSGAVNDVAAVFAGVQQASQLRITANASPPGATGPDVTSISVVAQDTGGLLKGMDATGKRTLADAILTAAGTAWPNASVSLLISDPSGAGGTVIGTRPKGGPNNVIAS
jgi:hypothetical protein